MARSLNRLTVRQVASIKTTGRHSDGGGLYLRVTVHGARAWVFMAKYGERRIEVGLGAENALTLAKARQLAGEMREADLIGKDPRKLRLPAIEPAAIPTFGEFSAEYISSIESGWRNLVHRQQWRNSLRDHASEIASIPVSDVSTDDVLQVLRPIWTDKPETAQRVRGRIERILDAAKAKGLRPADAMNPAVWRGHLAYFLPAPSKLTRGHHAALPWKDAPAFFSS